MNKIQVFVIFAVIFFAFSINYQNHKKHSLIAKNINNILDAAFTKEHEDANNVLSLTKVNENGNITLDAKKNLASTKSLSLSSVRQKKKNARTINSESNTKFKNQSTRDNFGKPWKVQGALVIIQNIKTGFRLDNKHGRQKAGNPINFQKKNNSSSQVFEVCQASYSRGSYSKKKHWFRLCPVRIRGGYKKVDRTLNQGTRGRTAEFGLQIKDGRPFWLRYDDKRYNLRSYYRNRAIVNNKLVYIKNISMKGNDGDPSKGTCASIRHDNPKPGSKPLWTFCHQHWQSHWANKWYIIRVHILHVRVQIRAFTMSRSREIVAAIISDRNKKSKSFRSMNNKKALSISGSGFGYKASTAMKNHLGRVRNDMVETRNKTFYYRTDNIYIGCNTFKKMVEIKTTFTFPNGQSISDTRVEDLDHCYGSNDLCDSGYYPSHWHLKNNVCKDYFNKSCGNEGLLNFNLYQEELP